MTDDLVKRARKLLKAATPGPWEQEYENERGPEYIAGPAHVFALWHHEDSQKQAQADAALIAAAPELLAALADRVEAQQKRIAELEAEAKRLQAAADESTNRMRGWVADALDTPDLPGLEACVLSLAVEHNAKKKRIAELEGQAIVATRATQAATVALEHLFAWFRSPPDDATALADAMTTISEAREALTAAIASTPERSERFIVRMICCGRDDGTFGPANWDECEAFRTAYLSGPGVGNGGHDRSAVIESERTEGGSR